MATLAGSLLLSSSAWAVAEHQFDSTLSLTGDGSVSKEDPVRDPGFVHPPQKFDHPCGVATDPHGYIYVASAAPGKSGTGTDGRIDVFNSKGEYLTQIKEEHQPCAVAVDSEGNVYVSEQRGVTLEQEPVIALFEPKTYPPIPGSEYGPRIEAVSEDSVKQGSECGVATRTMALDPSNDHLYVGLGCQIAEFASVAEGRTLIDDDIGLAEPKAPVWFYSVAVSGANHDIYAPGAPYGASNENDPDKQRVYVFDGTDGHLKAAYDGSDTPSGSFSWFAEGNNLVAVALDQSNGDFYLTQKVKTTKIEQLDASGHYVGTIEYPLIEGGLERPRGLAVDAPCRKGVGLSEPCRPDEAYDSPNAGHVFVTSGFNTANSHLFAFKPRVVGPPEVSDQEAIEIGASEAILRAELNPNGVPTSYRFEYISQAAFEAHGYEGASRAPLADADGGEAAGFAPVSEPIYGLQPGTEYRFRLVAQNAECPGAPTAGEGSPCAEGEDAAFATYPLQNGLSDGRAYELVTPADTNGRIPTMAEFTRKGSVGFGTALTSPDGESVVFGIEGGSLPDLGGGGYHDTYRAIRGPAGWQSHFTGLSAAEAETPFTGGISADHDYAFWTVTGTKGSLADPKSLGATYLRGPGGSVEPIGLGSLGVDLLARGYWIAPGASRVVFGSPESGGKQLEPEAPPSGTAAIYERSADGPTHVVSLLPGEITPAAEKNAFYQGTSANGEAIVFSIGISLTNSTLYARLHGKETVQVASGDVRFAGVSRDGDRVVYLRRNAGQPVLPASAGTPVPQGEIFACDVSSGPCEGPGAQAPIQIGSGNESVPVNVSADGSTVYFVSPKQLDGAAGTLGAHNLYAWRGGSVRFVATLSERDVIGEPAKFIFGASVDGLGLWLRSVGSGVDAASGPGGTPSRSIADGSALVFESNASPTAYDSGGQAEIYHYDAEAQSLACASCNPSLAPSVSDARMQSAQPGEFKSLPPVNSAVAIANLTADGQSVFFQSADKLALGDVDGQIDVYQWKAEGSPGCDRPRGCILLISSGKSSGDEYLYAMSPDGADVFFLSQDLLVAEDRDGTHSIYDARIGGGFPQGATPPGECLGEACQPSVVAPPDPIPAFTGAGNPPARGKARCPQGKRKVRRAGKVRCVKRDVKRKRGASAKRRAGR